MGLLKSLVLGLTSPLRKMAREKPLLFALVVGVGLLFLGIKMEWWSLESIKGLIPSFGKD